ncbi:response regulator receiver and ANTAR domain protein [Alkaliphilus metalliredigens QYMF]|uniref:Stage 0 sporulation protein A homolog n=1 Tax=Alkaliphilus metalliredigens (strain QYMF) TaxID=293826 RepID=A6TTJ5_ALKMQ|nr:ANTAR domain-containing protein [Alkaliphilus metalliredigens]ABR49513.1 response regulator receiver and ANTAR domain protein [Alkaliphilus metalliredigens QYMF]
MSDSRILVVDSGETSRKQISNLLSKRGYKIFQATDGAGAIRIARSIFPDLVLIDTNLWGMHAYEVASIIEAGRLSTVIFMTNRVDEVLYNKLKEMNLYTYIIKPIQPEQLYRVIEFAIINANKMNSLTKKIQKLEDALEGRKKVDRAKGILMEKLGIMENESYQLLRKQSMDQCISIHQMAEQIINQYCK